MYHAPRRHPLVLLLALALAACAPIAAAPADVLVADAPRDAAVPVDAATPVVVIAESATAEAELPALPPATCVVTTAPDPAYVPPSITVTYPGQFWYGSAALWADLPVSGAWNGLPIDDLGGYTQKLFFGREGYDWQAEPEPALTVSGRRLDAEAAPLVTWPATNGFAKDIGSFMLTGGSFPTAGCWEVTASYGAGTPAEASLTYVVWVAP